MSTATAARRECGPGRPRARVLGGGSGEVAVAGVCDPRGWETLVECSPFRAEYLVGTGPLLGARLLVAATLRVDLRQGRGLFPVARRLSKDLVGTRTTGRYE